MKKKVDKLTAVEKLTLHLAVLRESLDQCDVFTGIQHC